MNPMRMIRMGILIKHRRIDTAPPGHIIYEYQCRHFLFEKLGAVVMWMYNTDIPGGYPHILFWNRRFVKCFVYPLQQTFYSFFSLLLLWKGYNNKGSCKGRHITVRFYSGRWY